MLCQLEIPVATVAEAAQQARFLCLNAAPARPLPDGLLEHVDLLVVNRYELEAVGRFDGLTALTLGAEGAVLLEGGEEVARAEPPPVDAVDGTAAGDAFTACLLVSLLEGRDREEALPPRLRRRGDRRVAPGGATVAAHRGRGRRDTAAMKILLDCDPGHDDAIALLLALASPEVDLVGITTVHGNQTLEKTTVNALKLLEFVGRTDVPVAAGADRPLRPRAVRRRVRPRRERDGRPGAAAADHRAGRRSTRSTSSPRRCSRRPSRSRSSRPAR